MISENKTEKGFKSFLNKIIKRIIHAIKPVRGSDFRRFNLHPEILSNVEALGYQTPTPIQAEAIPAILMGKDVMGLAQTGTGKTAAFVLPIIQRLMNGSHSGVRALILAPTRELAQQIQDAVDDLAYETGLRSVALYGGVNIQPQIESLRRGVDIVVACPGRLLDHMQQETINLSRVEVLVLDEADQMFDMGFLPGIRCILDYLPKQLQTLLFSATMPYAIDELAYEVLRDPIVVKIGQSAPATSVKQTLFPVAQYQKSKLLLKILDQTKMESVLIFTRTKHGAQNVARKLQEAGFRAASLQGNLSQYQRQRSMDNFRKGSIKILVATDIASRGIDVSRISHVINYDLPDTAETYIHRIGRTGRASKLGEAFTFITQEDETEVLNIERILGRKLERCTLKDFDYGSAASLRSSERYRVQPNY